MLPRRMTVYVPRPLPGSATGLQLTLTDTRGLDGGVEARGDLQALLRDPRSLIVLCAHFKEAPGDTLRALLRSMDADAELRDAIPRILLLLLDQGDAEQVNGADDDREVGQELKIDECHRAQEGGGIAQLKISQITSFDVLKDDRKELVDAIDRPLNRMITRVREELEQRINNAREFLERLEDKLRPSRIQEVDRQIQQAMARHLPVDVPMHDALDGAYAAINSTRYASVVNAACRRSGTYSDRLELYAATRAEASRAASAWLDDLMDSVTEALDWLERDEALESVRDHVRLRRQQMHTAQLKVIRSYADQVQEQVQKELKGASIWDAYRAEWGRGPGYKQRVLTHLTEWSRRQQA